MVFDKIKDIFTGSFARNCYYIHHNRYDTFGDTQEDREEAFEK